MILAVFQYFAPHIAWAGCATYAQNGSSTDGYYLQNNCTAIINNYAPCKVVTNSTGAELFVPSYYPAATSTIGQNEWNSFLAHPPAGVSVASCSCTLPWGGSLTPGQSVAAYQNSNEPCHGSCTSQTRTCSCTDSSSVCVLSGSYTNQNCSVTACLACNLPWGGAISDSQSTTAYAASTVACGSSCAGQTRSCDNGTLSGSYTNQTCTVDACPCTLPWGGSINSGSNVTAYNYDSQACGGSCGSTNQQTRICSNGSLSGTFTNQNCTVDPCQCSATTYTWSSHCSGSVALEADGGSETVTNTASGYIGSATASCSNGTWSYSGASCAPSNCPLPWGGNLANADSVTAYQSANVAYGSTCVSQTRTCTTGTLSGSYTNQSCSVAAPASCTAPWGGSIAHGASVTAYQASSVAYGSTCVSQTRTCSNGTLSGSYTNQSCSVAAEASCTLPWGGTLAGSGSVTAYAASSVAYGSSCSGQTRTCNNGTLSGSYTNKTCTVDAPACCSGTSYTWNSHCTGIVSGNDSGTNQSVSNTASGYTGSVTASCTNGTWSYSSASCTAKSCTLPWGGTLASGSSVTAYAAASVPYGSSCTSQSRTCTTGSLSGSYTNKTCSVAAPANCSATTTTWSTNCSGAVAAQNHGGSETVTNTASGYTGSVTASCSNGSWSYTSPTCTVVSGGGGGGGGCFLGDTYVLMASGTSKHIEDLKVGDLVASPHGANRVLGMDIHSKKQKIYAFNGGKPFVTGEHVLFTTTGPKVIDPILAKKEVAYYDHLYHTHANTRVLETLRPGKLKVGDIIIMANGQFLPVSSITWVEKKVYKLFDPELDGDHMYYANGLLVHNLKKAP